MCTSTWDLPYFCLAQNFIVDNRGFVSNWTRLQNVLGNVSERKFCPQKIHTEARGRFQGVKVSRPPSLWGKQQFTVGRTLWELRNTLRLAILYPFLMTSDLFLLSKTKKSILCQALDCLCRTKWLQNISGFPKIWTIYILHSGYNSTIFYVKSICFSYFFLKSAVFVMILTRMFLVIKIENLEKSSSQRPLIFVVISNTWHCFINITFY